MIVPGGMGGICADLASRLPKNCVKLNRSVTSIDWSLLSRDPRMMDKVKVECVVTSGNRRGHDEFEEYYADYVISTLPLGVMKKYHQELFYPGLSPPKVIAIFAITLLQF